MLRALIGWLENKLLGLILRKDVSTLVACYVTLIVAGRRTFDQVPAKLQEAVRADLAASGLNENGEPIEL